MSSTAWKRCPNCCRDTRQDPITASPPRTALPPGTYLYDKPRLDVFIEKCCWHCKTEYRVNYHLILKDRVITKKGEDGWK